MTKTLCLFHHPAISSKNKRQTALHSPASDVWRGREFPPWYRPPRRANFSVQLRTGAGRARLPALQYQARRHLTQA